MRLHLSRIENATLRRALIVVTMPFMVAYAALTGALVCLYIAGRYSASNAYLTAMSAAPAWRGEHYLEEPLACEIGVRGAHIVICMPKKLLAFAIEHGRGAVDRMVVTDPDAFATAVAKQLLLPANSYEDEERTLIHKLFDDAAEAAIENGCEGIDFPRLMLKQRGTP